MGRLIEQLALEKGWEIIGKADIDCPEVYETAPGADICIDFSGAGAMPKLLAYLRRTKTPLLSGTTGLTEPDLDALHALGDTIPVIWTANYSTGIAVLRRMLRDCGVALADWDREIVEIHHNQKVDAPSGTALALADAINDARDNAYEYVYDRSQVRKKRDKKELGISAVRGGTIVGEHEVIFAGVDEVIEFKHTAYSKSVFAKGAVEAAKFLAGKPAGFYDMADVIG